MKYNIPSQLLFFRFKEFPKYKKVILTNIVWDYMIVGKTQFNKIIKWNFSKNLQKKLEKNWFWKNNENIKNSISAYRNKNSYLTWGPTLHIIVITKWCNLNCIYCHSKAVWSDIDKYHLNQEIANKYLDIIFTSISNSLTIEFQWWEPTTNWGTIEYIVKKANKLSKEKNKKIQYTMTTNCYNLTESQIHFMFENNFKINTSVDGVSNIHNINRPSFPNGKSFSKIEENIKIIKKLEKKYNKTLLTWWIAVITKHNLKNPEWLAQQYQNLNLWYVLVKYLDGLWRSEITKDFIGYTAEEFITFYKKHLEEIKNINLNWYKLIDGFVHIFIQKILGKQNPWYVDLQNPCWASIWQVDYDWNGDIYTCDEWRTVWNDIFKVWDWKNINNIKEIVQNETTAGMSNCSCLESNVCDMCVYQPYCGVCPVHNYINHGEIMLDIRDTFRHKFNVFIQDFVFEKIILDDKEWLKVFKTWLK